MIDAGNSYKDRVSRLISWGHWFLLANIVLAIAMSIRYLFAKDIDDSLLGILYLILTLIGHFGLLGIICYIVLLFPLTFVFPSSKVLRAIGAVIATIAIIALLIDGSIYQNYQIHLNLMVFDLEGFSLDSSIGWGTIALFLLAMLTVELTLANLIWKRLAIIRKLNIGNRIAGVFFGAFILSHIIHIWADATLYQPVLSYDRTLPLSHGSTARSLLHKYGVIDEFQSRQESNIGSNPTQINYPLRPLQCTAQTSNNLLFINIAVANNDFVTAELMPNLAKFATNSIVLSQHISTSLDSKLATFGIATGLPSQYQNAFDKQRLQPLLEQQSLAHQLEREYFSPSYFDKTTPSAALLDRTNTDSLIAFLTTPKTTGFYADITLFSSQELDSPSQFKPSIELDSSHLTAPERVLAKQYLRSLAYIDVLISDIIKQVDLTTTTVVVTANRGMDLTALYNSSNQYSKINLHVPLIIAMPNQRARVIDKLTSHYDILPTLLQHHFHCSNPPSDYSVGNDLFSNISNELIYIGSDSDFAIYQQQQIAEIDRQGNFKFYDSSYQKQSNGYLPFQALIDLMAKQRRFAN